MKNELVTHPKCLRLETGKRSEAYRYPAAPGRALVQASASQLAADASKKRVWGRGLSKGVGIWAGLEALINLGGLDLRWPGDRRGQQAQVQAGPSDRGLRPLDWRPGYLTESRHQTSYTGPTPCPLAPSLWKSPGEL